MPFSSTQFKSQYGPKYHAQAHLKGATPKTLLRYGVTIAPFGVAAGAAVLFFASGIPRVQTDILQKIPVIGPYFTKNIHPADSPF
ncbi:alpha- glucosyltransferase alg-10 [Ophiostoma piceae UAMH 11346]|uniref:Alpha-glucosyltransferase alg-10 n=1 Tax=Ophiostoma piceae (strain UAMH 11346) TaxID=1262450 RepID=S3C448_OPHP1|nr:alpha- glucosyltransferase alg-10 [Ophiostoma piceae UAMH 11346]